MFLKIGFLKMVQFRLFSLITVDFRPEIRFLNGIRVRKLPEKAWKYTASQQFVNFYNGQKTNL